MYATKAPAITPAELISSLTLSDDKELDDQIKNWIMWDKNAATLQQVVDAVKEQDWEALRTRLCRYNYFGTAGLRSGMRAGFDSINDLVTIQVGQGLSEYLQEVYPNVAKRESQGVVIGHDGRYNGKRFSQLLAAVFLNSNFKVYLFNRMTPSPMISFAVSHLRCLAGIAVTGSHNPKSDNGFKIYWSNGAPILTPHDKNIIAAMMKRLEPLPSSWDLSILDDHALLIDPFREVYPAYYETMKQLIPPEYVETNECSQLRFVYTALHGVGFQYVREAFYQARLKPLIPVMQQKDPDPDFPTISSPDPIDGKDSLALALKKANDEHCTIILANDPDADRLAVAELNPKGRWKLFNGNELGALLGWWALESYKMRTSKPNVYNCVMLSTTISSKILAAMARAEGFTHVETLVGFKWMANKAIELQGLGRTVLFAFEQPIGYMFSTMVADKDGINAACQVATMASHLRTTRSVTLIEKLREIYDTYGFHATISNGLTYDSHTKMTNMFNKLRSYEDNMPGTYPKCILNGEFEVKYVRDLTTGLDTSQSDKKTRLPHTPNKQSITFTFNNGMWIAFRDSGSQPKVRYYSELFGLPEEKDWDEISDTLRRMTDAVLAEFIRPSDYGMY
ncbi:glucose 1,6-bisphosphate synthase [Drosophila sulfurigaster albostrigata]|uniref:glucose 1,6-bisphosphate synthase n=1 Tax=Drosophila sulfurigaster albostrigata TaxID=89887 RepID=UPI002D219A5F|nr:glucose 1,6-bisphosphate synthase [Drosophila sulfurigaster albostrigata]